MVGDARFLHFRARLIKTRLYLKSRLPAPGQGGCSDDPDPDLFSRGLSNRGLVSKAG